MKKIILLIATALIGLQSCNECKEDFRLEQAYAIGFSLFDKDTNRNLLEISSYYNRDSVMVYNGNGEVIYPGPVPGDGIIYFRPYFGTDLLIPVNKDTTEYYYLHLIEQGLDVDTFRIDYRVDLDDCSEKKFTNLNFYYNEKLVFSDDQELHRFYVELLK